MGPYSQPIIYDNEADRQLETGFNTTGSGEHSANDYVAIRTNGSPFMKHPISLKDTSSATYAELEPDLSISDQPWELSSGPESPPTDSMQSAESLSGTHNLICGDDPNANNNSNSSRGVHINDSDNYVLVPKRGLKLPWSKTKTEKIPLHTEQDFVGQTLPPSLIKLQNLRREVFSKTG